MKKRIKMFGMICMSVLVLAIGCSNNNDYIDSGENEKDDEQKYVWLQVSLTSSTEISYEESQRKWIYYNDPMDYKYIDEVRSESEVNDYPAVTATITEIATSDSFSVFQTNSNGVSITYKLKYFQELLPLRIPKSVYMKYSYTDGKGDEITDADYTYEYLDSENDSKVIKVTQKNIESDVYAVYKIKDGVIVETSTYSGDKIMSRTKISDDEFLAELGLYETYSYTYELSNQPASTKYILKDKTKNDATVGMVTTIPSEILDYYDEHGYYHAVTDIKYKRFAYPFSN